MKLFTPQETAAAAAAAATFKTKHVRRTELRDVDDLCGSVTVGPSQGRPLVAAQI